MDDIKFTAVAYTEDNGSVTLSLDDIDIVVNGSDLAAAKRALAEDILGYAQDYCNDFARYSNAPNRRAHLPYVVKALAAGSLQELENAIVCRDAANE